MATSVICNKCGSALDFWDTQENFTISTHIGYGSKHDGDKLELHLCCNCMDELISQCKFSPIVENDEL